MPKGRGHKGSKASPKKPKSIPVENRYELNPTPVSTSQSTPISPAPVQDLSHHTYSPSSIINISSSPSHNAPVSLSVNHLPPAMPFSYMSYPPLPPAFSSTTFPSPQGFTVDPTIGGHNPFRVCFVAGNIRVCHGCKGKYFKDAGPHMTCVFSMKNGVHSHPKAPQNHRDIMAMFITTVVSHALLLSGRLSSLHHRL